MSSQSQHLHRALLRPMVIHTLRAAGFHSTRPSVLDTFTSLAERYLLLLASTAAAHARNAHADAQPGLSDVRLALRDCGAVAGGDGASEEEWAEVMRVPVEDLAHLPGLDREKGGEARRAGEKRKRDTHDASDVASFLAWFDGSQHAEITRIAGMSEASGTAAVGVGGGKVAADDFLLGLKRKQARIGGGPGGVDEARWVGTALGSPGDDRDVWVEGGPVQSINEWRPPKVQQTPESQSTGTTDGTEDERRLVAEAPG